jgi:hypothetical protein
VVSDKPLQKCEGFTFLNYKGVHVKYKIGDKVTIRKDLSAEEGAMYYMDGSEYWDDCTTTMVGMGGLSSRVIKAGRMGYLLEDGRGYLWTDEMFE